MPDAGWICTKMLGYIGEIERNFDVLPALAGEDPTLSDGLLVGEASEISFSDRTAIRPAWGKLCRSAWARTRAAGEGSYPCAGVDCAWTARTSAHRKMSFVPAIEYSRALNTWSRPSDPRRVHDREYAERSYV